MPAPRPQALSNISSCTRGSIMTIAEDAFSVMTLHRPSNVDDPDVLARLMGLVVDGIAEA